MDRTEETRVHELELNASASAKVGDVLVVAAGLMIGSCFRCS